jgi:hypothetical protein
LSSHFQRVPFVTGLSTAFLAARFSQTAIAGLLEPITGRRFATVAAVLGQLVFQRLDSLFETLNDFLLRLGFFELLLKLFLLLVEKADPVADQVDHHCNDCIFALASSVSNFFFRRDASRLHGLILAEMHDFDNGKVQHSELWAAPADGSGEYALLDVSALGALDPSALGTAVVQFEWVPGTHQLAFNTRQVFEGPGTALYNDLRLIDVTTGELSLLFPPGQGGMFYYSPDGSRLALVTPERIELVSADGSDRAEALSFPKVITYSEYELYPVPSWSPDGQSLRVAIPPADPMAEPPQPTTLWLIEAGASPTAIQTGQVATLPFNFFTTLFSPDHAHVAYVSVLGDPADNLWDLRLANANGSGARSIATRPLVSFLAWSPASDWFAFVTGQEQDTHVGSLSGEIRTLPRSPGEWIQGLQWISSDQVLYAVGSHLPGEWRLMLATLGQAEILTIDTGLESPYTLDWSR